MCCLMFYHAQCYASPYRSYFRCNMSSDAKSKVDKQPNSKPLLNVSYVEISSRAEEIQAGLIDTFLNLERVDTNLYVAHHLLKGRQSLSAVYGGQVIGHALTAAIATVEDGFVPHSLHSYFLKTGDVAKPILYMIDRIRDGRSFCTRLVKAQQDGEAIFTSQISFHRPEGDSIRHQHVMPTVTPPEELEDVRQVMESALLRSDLPKGLRAMLRVQVDEIPPAFDRVFQIRPVNPSAHILAEPSETRTFLWMKANENIGDDPRLHLSCAAYISDCSMIETAMRPHCQKGFIPSMALTLDHSIWMHSTDFRIDDWMLYENYSSYAGGGRTFTEGRLWTRDGRLVFSTAQEGLVRAPRPRPPPSAAPVDAAHNAADK